MRRTVPASRAPPFKFPPQEDIQRRSRPGVAFLLTRTGPAERTLTKAEWTRRAFPDCSRWRDRRIAPQRRRGLSPALLTSAGRAPHFIPFFGFPGARPGGKTMKI